MKNPNLSLLCIFLFLNGFAKAQNWNVFNPNYRYNYKYDNSQLISQVLFADSIKVSGGDSNYYINRIGVGVFPAPISVNMPQFLQRTIHKYSNGIVMLSDTAKLVIHPFCQLNQTWLFDSINLKTASCVSQTVQTIFGMSDSLKIIIINGADTLKLSKQFGILQFPKLYNQNKYFRLAGIEHAATYDSIPFYGERVPNAWDIYNFNAGDRFCFSDDEYHKQFGNMGYKENYSIRKKNIGVDGYYYDVEGAREAWFSGSASPTVSFPAINSSTYTTLNFSALSSSLTLANRMYPGQMISGYYTSPGFPSNIVSFGTDNNGLFYKFSGRPCIPNSTVIFPFTNSNTYVSTDGILTCSQIYGVGLGELTYQRTDGASGTNNLYNQQSLCMTCAVKGGASYFGTETYVGIKEQKLSTEEIRFYPNPVKDELTIEVGNTSANELRLINILGETVFTLNDINSNQKIQVHLNEQQCGIYFVQLLQNSTSIYTKKIVKN